MDRNYRIIENDEFYRDISRKENPKWPGWNIIDDFKERFGTFKECQDKCGDLEHLYCKFKNSIL